MGFDGFRQGIRSLAPGLDDGQLKALFDRHASVGLDAIAGPHAAQLGYAAFAKALFSPEATVTANTARPSPRAPPPFVHPWDNAAPQASMLTPALAPTLALTLTLALP